MRRTDHRAALTEALTKAIARFQADLLRLAQTHLREQLARTLATTRLEDAGAPARSAPRRPRKPAVVKPATRRTRTRAEAPVTTPAKAIPAIAVVPVAAPTIVEPTPAPDGERTPTTADAGVVAAASTQEPAASTYDHEARWERTQRRRAARMQRKERRQDRSRERRQRGEAFASAARPEPTTVSEVVRWSREAIITELASWMVDGAAVDASRLERFGPPGLVPAARQVFGGFDAALSVARENVTRLYPERSAAG